MWRVGCRVQSVGCRVQGAGVTEDEAADEEAVGDRPALLLLLRRECPHVPVQDWVVGYLVWDLGCGVSRCEV